MAKNTLPLPEPKGWNMPDDSRPATRLDFIRAKLGSGPWPICSTCGDSFCHNSAHHE